MEFKNLSIESESNRFDKHLKVDKNSRIIFSGIFGIGKTYFLEKFFEPSSENYIAIKLNPVNYSVSSNEDIFELIKYDIGFELFSKNVEFENIKLNTLIASEYYLVNNYEEIIRELIENLPKLDHQLDNIIKPILKLYDKIKVYKTSLEIDDKKELEEFLSIFTNKEGTYREENSISKLISKLVESLKINNPKKEIVLIIDDLDRIDPEHIFRIMNIFSAHYDYFDQKDENKFGFDKVILVCDINNIRGIFHSKYGSEIDFTGYIDKFYSHEVFEYNFTEVISNNLNKFISSIKLVPNSTMSTHFDIRGYGGVELMFLLSELVKSNSLSMRALLNFLKSEVIISNYAIKTNLMYSGNIYSQHTPVLVVLDIIENILGGKDNFIKAIEKLIKYRPVIEFSNFSNYWNLKIGNLIMLADYLNSNLTMSEEVYNYSNKALDLRVSYTIVNTGGYSGVVGKAERVLHFSEDINEENYDYNERIKKTKIPYYQILKQAYQNLSLISKE